MKKTILVISSEPTNLIPLRTGNERKEIKAVTNNQSNHVHFDIREENAVTFDDLMHAFEEHKPNIIHFIGHGKGEDGLCLQNDDNKEQLVKNDIL